MADVFSKSKRSSVMSLIRSRGNKDTELRLAALLRQFGIKGWRRHARLPGTPDFVYRASRLAIFVDGCFWHGCPRCYRRPKQNRPYWNEKILKNKRRDRRTSRRLKLAGWDVLRIWECRLARFPLRVIGRIGSALCRRAKISNESARNDRS